jgi:hypothetical protein
MRKARRQAEVERLQAELEESRPFLGLAREIHEEVSRLAEDPTADSDVLIEAIEQLPREARLRAAEAAFRSLPAEQQWEILIRLFDDDELREALGHERSVRLAAARDATQRAALVERFKEQHVLDTREVPVHERLTLGLFREADVQPALARGPASTACARRLVLRATGDGGVLQVMEDVFNPAGGLFVTVDYDERAWRDERLTPHALVRVGSAKEDGQRDRFDPVVYPGGRVDVELGGSVRRGRLHAGYALVGDRDLFSQLKGGTS